MSLNPALWVGSFAFQCSLTPCLKFNTLEMRRRNGISSQSKKCWKRGGDISFLHRSCSDHPGFFHFRIYSMGCRIGRSGCYPYLTIWILTLKRIYAEGLQQRRRKKEISILRINTVSHTTRFWLLMLKRLLGKMGWNWGESKNKKRMP